MLKQGKVRGFMIAMLLLWPLLSAVSAEEQRVELATDVDFAPYISKAHLNDGLLTDIVRQSLKLEGVDLDLLIRPWPRSYRDLELKRIIGTFAWVYSKEREEKFHLSDVIYIFKHVFISHDSDFRFPSSLHDSSAERTWCYPLGWTIPDFIRPHIEHYDLRVVNPTSLENCYQLVKTGRADFTLLPTLTAGHLMKNGSEGVFLESYPSDVDHNYAHVLFAKTQDGEIMRNLFNRGLSKLIKSGGYRETITAHLEGAPDEIKDIVLANIDEFENKNIVE